MTTPITACTVSTWQDAATAYWAASVPIGGHNVEFIVNTPLTGVDDSGAAVTYTDDQLAAALQVALRATVDAQLVAPPQPLTGVLSGTVTL
jgi:hypothetical protein